MPINPIGDLNTGRRIADDFVVTLTRRRNEAGELEWRVLVSCALVAGDIAIAGWNAEDITAQLSASQRSSVQNLASAAESRVLALLGL